VSVGVLTSADLVKVAAQKIRYEPAQAFREKAKWNPEDFGRQQIRGLVRQVFFSREQQVRQVVFFAAEFGAEVGSVCWQVAESLALDTSGNVAVASRNREPSSSGEAHMQEEGTIVPGAEAPQYTGASRIHRNLWLVPRIGPLEDDRVLAMTVSARLSELRREFEYSIVQGPAGNLGEAAALGQGADGIVLLLAAHVTRRATAVKIKQTLESAQVRLLGTVLTERRFPIPERIYRRL